MSCPVALLYVSISWLNLVAPSEAVKKMSFPLAWALVCKSGSVLLIRTGNSVSWPLTWVALTVIFFRYFHVPSAGSQVVDVPIKRVVKVHRDRAAASFSSGWAVKTDERRAGSVLEGEEIIESPAREAANALVDGVDSDRFDVLETDFDRGQVEVVEGAIFERGFALGQVILVALHRGDGNGAAREPWTPKFSQRLPACDEGAHAGRIAKHLVEREVDEFRLPAREVETVGGNEGRGVEHLLPAFALGAVDPIE